MRTTAPTAAAAGLAALLGGVSPGRRGPVLIGSLGALSVARVVGLRGRSSRRRR